MRPSSAGWMAAQMNAQAAPLWIAALWTAQGAHLYSMVGLTDAEAWCPAASPPIIDRKPILLSTSPIREEMPLLVLGGLGLTGGRSLSDCDCRLRNDDDYCGRLLATDTLLSQRLTIVLGWRGLAHAGFVARFQGVVHDYLLTPESLTLHAVAA